MVDQRSSLYEMRQSDLHPQTLPSIELYPGQRSAIIGQLIRQTYSYLVYRKYVFGFVDIWGGILSRV